MKLSVLCSLLLLGIVSSIPLPTHKSEGKKIATLALNKLAHVQNDNLINNKLYKYMSTDVITDYPVFGDEYPAAIFWLFLDVGNPSVKFPVAIDSGSFTLDIPSVNCQGCVKDFPNNIYDSTKSSTSEKKGCGLADKCFSRCKNNQCTFSNTYQTCDLSNPTAPCTISGEYYYDEVTLAGLGPVKVEMGVITYQTTNFDQFKIIDGVIGMGRQPGNSNVFGTIVEKGLVDNDVWSICLHHGSTSNGTIVFGGIDDRLYHGNVSYVPNIDTTGLYSLKLNALKFNGVNTLNSPVSAILDSGTNVLLVPTPIFNNMKQYFLRLCSNANTNNLHGICDQNEGNTLFDSKCFDYNDDDMNLFPDLEFSLDNDVTLTMTAQDYLVNEVGSAPNSRCLGIRPTGKNGFLIIGDNTMQKYLTVFDIDNNRIGWAPVNSDNCGSL